MCKLKTILTLLKLFATDLLCWLCFVPLCNGSGDESVSV